MTDRRAIGIAGERAAVEFLGRQGVKLVARNFRTRLGEIDIVGLDGDEYVFVEVKTRVGGPEVAPDEIIDTAKLERLGRLAELYIREARQSDAPWRVDVVAVVLDDLGRTVSIERLEGAYL